MSGYDLLFSKSALTRFSHDLAGVVGAISSSLSLLAETDTMDREILDLALNNANILMGRLRFFRAAFGNDGPLTDIATTKKIIEDYLKTLENRVAHFSCYWEINWNIPVFAFRYILLTVQIIAENMIRGGKIFIKLDSEDKKISIQAEGQSIVDVVGLSENSETDDLQNLRLLPVFFLKKCLEEQNWQFSCFKNETKIAMLLNEKNVGSF